MLTDIVRDLRYGLRTMLRNRIFTLVAVVTLAIGIGANAVVFSLVDRILLRALPYPEPDRLVRLLQAYPENGLDRWGLSPANFASYHEQNRSFEAVAAYSSSGATLTGTERPEYLQAGRVTADFFKVFAVKPALGRTFLPGEDAPGENNVCVLSHGLWQRRFGGDPQVIGKSLVLNDVPTEVIGVMPPGFKFPNPEIDLWVPVALNPQAFHPFLLTGVARLKPGVAPLGAEADTTSILRNAAQENPETVARKSPPPPGAGLKTLVVPLKTAIIGDIERPLLILQIAVALVLLIACANVANLLLSRATQRTQEIAMRLALGATASRIIRQLVTESLLLAVVGAAAGVAFAAWCLSALNGLSVEGIPRIEETGLSWGVLAFTAVVTVVTGILFGLMPAVRAYWMGVKRGLGEGQKSSASVANRRMNSALVAVQLAISLMLLIGAGLMLKSFQRLLTVDPGFEADKVLTMVLPVSSKKYASPGQSLNFFMSLLEEVRAIPGVRAAGTASNIPFSGRNVSDGHIVEGQETPQGDAPQAQIKVVSPGYFQAMGMRLQQGRDFQDSDTEDGQRVAIVDTTLSRQYWPNGDALGKRIRTLDPDWYTIVGVVSPVKDSSLSGEVRSHLYFPFEQLFFAYGQGAQRRMYFVVNTGTPDAVVPAIRERIQRLDPDVPMHAVSTMSELISQQLNSQRLISVLLTAFAAMALLLAAIGTYGVMSVFVNSRSPEFAIRLALGAQPRNLLFLVLRQGFVLAAVGVTLGLLGSWALTRAIASQLFEVSTTDPVIFTMTPAVLILVAILACFLPARRAARTDPAIVLRNQ